MKYIQTDAPLPETASSLQQSVIARTTTTSARSTDLHIIGENGTSTDDSIALQRITHGILTGASPIKFTDARNRTTRPGQEWSGRKQRNDTTANKRFIGFYLG